MSTINKVFSKLKKQRKKALICYITCGDPSLLVTEKLIYTLEKSGADIIELGIPFSDSLADGPVIQASHQRAIKQKTNLDKAFALVARVRTKTSIPLVFMSSLNLIYQYGEKRFMAEAKKHKLDGVIIPDLPVGQAKENECSGAIYRAAPAVDIIYLAAPNTTPSRLKQIAKKSQGFIYLISVAGITGARKSLPKTVSSSVSKLRRLTKKPIAVGFGISKPAQAKEVSTVADGVIVGSAIVDIIANNKGQGMLDKVGRFVASLRTALNKK